MDPHRVEWRSAIDIDARSHISLRMHHFHQRGSLMRRKLFLIVPALLAFSFPIAADQLPYQKPPKEILDILNAPALPALSVNPTRTYATLSQSERYPSIAEVSAAHAAHGRYPYRSAHQRSASGPRQHVD